MEGRKKDVRVDIPAFNEEFAWGGNTGSREEGGIQMGTRGIPGGRKRKNCTVDPPHLSLKVLLLKLKLQFLPQESLQETILKPMLMFVRKGSPSSASTRFHKVPKSINPILAQCRGEDEKFSRGRRISNSVGVLTLPANTPLVSLELGKTMREVMLGDPGGS